MELRKIKDRMPEAVKQPLRRMRRLIGHLPNLGTSRYCPVCRMPSREFAEAGADPREDAMCTYCGALERHRLVWAYFERMTGLFDGTPKKVLHVAPEGVFRDILQKQIGAGYLTADLFAENVMIKMDVEDIKFDDDSFDVIYCSHVLEHVPDDRRAMREFRRVLKPHGWAILLVPVVADRTFEDPSITDPAERARLFGQEDHLRNYGPDYKNRLEEAGFKVQVVQPIDFLSNQDIARMGITKAAGDVYRCTK
jgi:SAM-dependent methyltransferase